MDTNATVIISALRAEAAQQISDATEAIYGGPAYVAVALGIGATLNSLADRIERELTPSVQLSTEPKAALRAKVSQEMVENVAAAPDPEPYVGFSGRRYTLGGSTSAALNDGPVAFDPRPFCGPTEDER